MKTVNAIKGLVLLALFFIGINQSKAQKYCYVNSDYILANIPEYKTAQSNLDQLSAQWQKEIETKYTEIDKLYKSYQAEQILLTEDLKKKRIGEIEVKEKEAKELQKTKFGYEGELFKKRQEMVKPIQDKIYAAIKKFAEDGSYGVIFDKSSDLIMLYTNPKYDKSDEILLAMGFKAGIKEDKNGAKGGQPGSKDQMNKQQNAPMTPGSPKKQ
ncbi:MAG: OmpH family outer membrane protein [Bacteroidota bacterium]